MGGTSDQSSLVPPLVTTVSPEAAQLGPGREELVHEIPGPELRNFVPQALTQSLLGFYLLHNG